MTDPHQPTIAVQMLPHAFDLPPPAYQTAGAAGIDLVCALPVHIMLYPRERLRVPTGIAVELPPGYEGQIRARSGLALAHGVTLANAVGTIDSDYRGEIKVILLNLGEHPFRVDRGARIAQMVIARVCRADIQIVPNLTVTDRAAAGFGSTGL